MDDFVIVRNPDADSALLYLLRLPLPRPVVLKARETWPRTAKVYCHRAETWPEEPDTVERVLVKSCTARGPAVGLVLDRGRENRSQLVFTRLKGGREAIFWQSPRYPYRFSSQQATTVRGGLPCGDYGVRSAGSTLAVVERKSLEDLARSLVDGRLAELATVPRSAVVVEERYSRVFSLPYVKPGFVADLLARVQVRWPSVPVFFAETRPLAEEWTFRFLGAALSESVADGRVQQRLADLSAAGELAPAPPTPGQVRAWALESGLAVSAKGRIPAPVLAAYEAAQSHRG